MKIFRLSVIDFYLPLSQLRQSKTFINQEATLKVPGSKSPEIKENNSLRLDVDITWNNRARVLNPGQGFDNDLKDSLEGIFKRINMQKDKLSIPSFCEELKKDTEKLILQGKLNLHYISKIYEIVCRHCYQHHFLWEFYDQMISNYFFSFTPEDLIRIMIGYTKLSVLSPISKLWVNKISKLQDSQLDDYSIEELSTLLYLCDCFSITHPVFAMKKLKAANHESCDPYYLYFQVKYKKLEIAEPVIEKMTLDMKCEFACMFLKLNYQQEIFDKLIHSICAEAVLPSVYHALKVCDVILHSKSNFSYASVLASKFQGKVKNLCMEEFKSLLEILCILKNMDEVVGEDFLLELEESFFRFAEYLNEKNLSSFTHFFAYSMPMKSAHRHLCDLIMSCENPDTIEKNKPQHMYYLETSDSKFQVFNNSLLNKMNLQSLNDLIICMPFRYQLSRDLWAVIKKYMRLIVKKFFYVMIDKHKCKFMLILSKPENFDKELIDEIFDRLFNDFPSFNKFVNSYVFVLVIKNLRNLNYSHPALKYTDNKLNVSKFSEEQDSIFSNSS